MTRQTRFTSLLLLALGAVVLPQAGWAAASKVHNDSNLLTLGQARELASRLELMEVISGAVLQLVVLDKLPDRTEPIDLLNDRWRRHFDRNTEPVGVLLIILGRNGGMIHKVGDATAAAGVNTAAVGAAWPGEPEAAARRGEFPLALAKLLDNLESLLTLQRRHAYQRLVDGEFPAMQGIEARLAALYRDHGVDVAFLGVKKLPFGVAGFSLIRELFGARFPTAAAQTRGLALVQEASSQSRIEVQLGGDIGRAIRASDVERLWRERGEPLVRQGRVPEGWTAFLAALDPLLREKVTRQAPPAGGGTAPVGLINLALRRPVTASAVYRGQAAVNAVDGTEAAWVAASPTGWLEIDLEQDGLIHEIRIEAEGEIGNAGRLRLANATGRELTSLSFTAKEGQPAVVTFRDPVAGVRKIRLEIAPVGGRGDWCSIREVTVLGTGGGAPAPPTQPTQPTQPTLPSGPASNDALSYQGTWESSLGTMILVAVGGTRVVGTTSQAYGFLDLDVKGAAGGSLRNTLVAEGSYRKAPTFAGDDQATVRLWLQTGRAPAMSLALAWPWDGTRLSASPGGWDIRRVSGETRPNGHDGYLADAFAGIWHDGTLGFNLQQSGTRVTGSYGMFLRNEVEISGTVDDGGRRMIGRWEDPQRRRGRRYGGQEWYSGDLAMWVDANGRLNYVIRHDGIPGRDLQLAPPSQASPRPGSTPRSNPNAPPAWQDLVNSTGSSGGGGGGGTTTPPVTKLGDQEPNDTAAAAGLLTLGATVTGTVHDRQDRADWYRLELPDDGSLVIALTGNPSHLTLGIYREDDLENSLPEAGSPEVRDQLSRYGLTGLSRTALYVQVTPRGRPGRVEYTLAAAFEPSAVPSDPEPNDNMHQARALEPGQTVSGRIGYGLPATARRRAQADYDDFYRVQVTRAGTLTVSLDERFRIGGDNDADLTVLDARGNELGSRSGLPEVSWTSGVLQPGYYYIRVSSPGNGSGGAYRLSAAFRNR